MLKGKSKGSKRQALDAKIQSNAEDSGNYSVVSPVASCESPAHLYFTIYYTGDDDGAFRRAALTWVQETMDSQSYRACDKFIVAGAKTEAEFRSQWMKIYKASYEPDWVVVKGNIFSHASKDGDSIPDGLEFKRGVSATVGSDDGTLEDFEIRALSRLNWRASAWLVLSSCNTGSLRDGWAPAKSFAESQKVDTIGQAGYAYFSTKKDRYEKIDGSSETVYLWAYQRMRNALFLMGSGDRMSGKWYYPARVRGHR